MDKILNFSPKRQYRKVFGSNPNRRNISGRNIPRRTRFDRFDRFDGLDRRKLDDRTIRKNRRTNRQISKEVKPVPKKMPIQSEPIQPPPPIEPEPIQSVPIKPVEVTPPKLSDKDFQIMKKKIIGEYFNDIDKKLNILDLKIKQIIELTDSDELRTDITKLDQSLQSTDRDQYSFKIGDRIKVKNMDGFPENGKIGNITIISNGNYSVLFDGEEIPSRKLFKLENLIKL